MDLGGGNGDFMLRLRKSLNARYIVADIEKKAVDEACKRGFEGILLSESKPLPFENKQIDIVFCNSVIEHVTLPKDSLKQDILNDELWKKKSFAIQKDFAMEISRIGKSYFVQTPHKHFPIEAHTWLPLVNWLPHNQTVWLTNITDKYWVKKVGYVDWNLLDINNMKELFPDANIKIEKFMGLPKSIIAYKPFLPPTLNHN